MCLTIFEEFPDDLKDVIIPVLDARQIDVTSMTGIWRKDKILENVEGFLAILEFEPKIKIGVIYLPIVIMPVYGIYLSEEDVGKVAERMPDISGTKFVLKGNVVFYERCMPLDAFEEEQLEAVFDTIITEAEGVHTQLHAAIRQNFDFKDPEEWSYPEPVLPNIKMTPKQLKIITEVFSHSAPRVRKIFTFLMVEWTRAGHVVGTTSSSIVLDVPYADRTARLAMLFPGVSEGLAALQAGQSAYPPLIILFWESLRQYKGFPAKSVDAYQETIKKIAPLRLTRSSAYVDISHRFALKEARAFLTAMKTLAATLKTELIEPPTTSGPVTPKNVEITLATCPKYVRAVYRELLETWGAAGGTIECNKPGRIQLKMVTKEHERGDYAQIKRRFSLVVLAGPRGKQPANMKIGWNLAELYLDCIPRKVAQFETKVMSLPGFERNKTMTYIWMDKKFTMLHAKVLGKAIIDLKKAEQAAP